MNSPQLLQQEQTIRAQAAADGMTHLSTGIAVVRDDKLLVVRRAAADYLGGSYELPGGGIDSGESFEQSIRRELLEETGLTITEIISLFEGFDYSTDKKPRVRQTNFLVEAGGDVVLDPAEHDEYRWIIANDIDDLPTNDVMRTCLRNAFAAQEKTKEFKYGGGDRT